MLRILLIIICAIVAFWLLLWTLVFLSAAPPASAGQTGGFAPYAKQGILNRLHVIYPGGNPYKVTCTERDSINSFGVVKDTVTCIVSGP